MNEIEKIFRVYSMKFVQQTEDNQKEFHLTSDGE